MRSCCLRRRQLGFFILGMFTLAMNFLTPSAKGLIQPSFLTVTRNLGCYGGIQCRRRFGTFLSAWNVGDVVLLPKDKDTTEMVKGVVKEIRGSGWYEVMVQEDSRVIKCRATQLRAFDDAAPPLLETVSPSNITNASIIKPFLGTPLNSAPLPPPPTVVDLDAAILDSAADPVERESDRDYLDHVTNHMSYNKWVVFTDLHCAPSTLNTTLQVLDYVHKLAVEREAGVLFLGDFWHHRGTIRVDCLNAVLDAFQTWTVPMVMIPGNHDQVTLGGHNHGLTPLQNAYRVASAGRTHRNGTKTYTGEIPPETFPGPLIFSHPTVFANALLIPHIRDNAVMESVLQSKHAQDAKIILAHADITGAYMNDLIVSLGGVSPSMFPPNKPIYSGHFHKPHVVETKSKNVSIEYLGSPYQVSLSEAQQDKAFAVLDSSNGWECVERIPLDIGRKHFRVDNLDDFLKVGLYHEAADTMDDSALMVRPDDRVVVSIDKKVMNELRRSASAGEDNPLVVHVDMLRTAGVTVEVRELIQEELPSSTENGHRSFQNWQDVSPVSIWNAFLDDEIAREALSNATAGELRTIGSKFLQELGENDAFQADRKHGRTELQLDSVSVEGFGPFQGETSYPLRDRGLVLLRGSNRDGGSDSNGSGKTSLAVSTLWALTGSVDPRPLQDSKVSDVINDSSKVARVTVRGSLNGEEFSVTRSKTSRGGSLIFMLDGQDLTMQSVKETQVLIEEKLGISPQILARTLFHGQHAINELLEASDAKFKEELSLVVPIERWQEAASKARKLARVSSKRAAELDGMVSIRVSDLEEAIERLKTETDSLTTAEARLRDVDSVYNKELRLQSRQESFTDEQDSAVDTLRSMLHDHERQFELLEEERCQLDVHRKKAISDVEMRLSRLETDIRRTAERILTLRHREEEWALRLASIKDTMNNLESMWELPSLELGVPEEFALPQVCPTCQQSLSDHGEGHVHGTKLQQEIIVDMQTAVEKFNQARNEVISSMESIREEEESRQHLESKISEEKGELVRVSLLWDDRVDRKDKEVQGARHSRDQTSKQLADVATRLQRNASLNRLQINLEAEQHRLQLARATVDNMQKQVAKYEQVLQGLREERDGENNSTDVLTGLADAFGQRGVQTFVLQRAVKLLEDATQSYLTELSDGCQRLELRLDSGERIVRRPFVVGQRGEFVERPVASLSGGQYRRCSLALSLGFAELVAQRGNFRPSLCIFDEPLTHLDRTGRSKVGRVLKRMVYRAWEGSGGQSLGLEFSTVLLILQDLAAEELEENFDCIDEVVKRGSASHVVVDGEGVVS